MMSLLLPGFLSHPVLLGWVAVLWPSFQCVLIYNYPGLTVLLANERKPNRQYILQCIDIVYPHSFYQIFHEDLPNSILPSSQLFILYVTAIHASNDFGPSKEQILKNVTPNMGKTFPCWAAHYFMKRKKWFFNDLVINMFRKVIPKIYKNHSNILNFQMTNKDFLSSFPLSVHPRKAPLLLYLWIAGKLQYMGDHEREWNGLGMKKERATLLCYVSL